MESTSEGDDGGWVNSFPIAHAVDSAVADAGTEWHRIQLYGVLGREAAFGNWRVRLM